MKKYTTILFSLIAFYCSAQFPKEYLNQPANLKPVINLDNSIMQCVYQHTTYDPDLDRHEDTYEILEIGNNYSKYGSYGAYQVDSALRTYKGATLTNGDYVLLAKKYDPDHECIIKNMKDESLEHYGIVFIDHYIYQEPIPRIEWTLEGGEAIICGHTCYKATATFRGRQWTAWYSDIPVDNGPWKLGNLPGLILKAEDATGEHIIEAIILKQDKASIGYRKFLYSRTTREKYNKSLKEYKEEAHKFFQGELQPQNPDGTPMNIPKRKLFYNPLEKE